MREGVDAKGAGARKEAAARGSEVVAEQGENEEEAEGSAEGGGDQIKNGPLSRILSLSFLFYLSPFYTLKAISPLHLHLYLKILPSSI